MSLTDDYYKVNSFLIAHDTLIYKNVVLPKSLYLCIIRFELMKSVTHGEGVHKEWSSLITIKMASTREAMEKVEPSRKRGMLQTRKYKLQF